MGLRSSCIEFYGVVFTERNPSFDMKSPLVLPAVLMLLFGVITTGLQAQVTVTDDFTASVSYLSNGIAGTISDSVPGGG